MSIGDHWGYIWFIFSNHVTPCVDKCEEFISARLVDFLCVFSEGQILPKLTGCPMKVKHVGTFFLYHLVHEQDLSFTTKY